MERLLIRAYAFVCAGVIVALVWLLAGRQAATHVAKCVIQDKG
jgi:hypothetical protein